MKKFQPEKGYDEIFSVVACRAADPYCKIMSRHTG